MEILHQIEEKVLLIFAQLFKIQSNWFLEFLSVSFSLLLIFFLIWSILKMSKKKKYKREKGMKRYYRRTIYYATIGTALFFSICTIVHTSLVVYIAASEYKLSDFSLKEAELHQEFLNVDIYDKDGNKVYTIINDGINRETVSLNEVPQYLKEAFVNVEDQSFYQHTGISIRGYLRAIVYKVLKPSQSMHGGSTLTQQLVKNAKGDMYNRTVLHKYQEALQSVIIENKYDKKEILEMYLNRIYLGVGTGNIHGVGTASKYYFNKHISELTLAQSAFLAGLPQAPSAYTEDLKLGNKRKNTVLDVMKNNGAITENQWKRAKQETVTFSTQEVKQSAIAAYADYVLKEAKEVYGIGEEDLKHKGYDIYTHLDTNLQTNMQKTVNSFTFNDDKPSEKALVQVGMAAVDSNSGKIIALYGGRDYIRGYRNRSYDRFQPGSILKPLVVYGPAFETGKWNAFSKVSDKLTNFNGYEPHNAGDVYEGDITIERALIRSANVPTVSVLKDIGVEKATDTLKKLEIPIEKEDHSLHLALGGMEKGVTPIEMAQSYATFQNFGYFEPAHAIKYVKDKNGSFIAKEDELETKGKDIYTPENAYHMTEILKKVITDKNGTGKNANIGRPVAGKTGTAEEPGTSGNRAAWFVGYTPEISMAVHLGFDEPSSTRYLTTSGGGEPAKLFAEIMKNTLVNTPVKEFKKPSDVVSLSEGPLLTKVEHVEADFDKEKGQVEIKWDEIQSFGGIVYKIYKEKDGETIELGTTNENIFYDKNLSVKTPLEEIPKTEDWQSDWKENWQEKLGLYAKNALTIAKDLVWEKHTYYIIATYEDKATEPSEKEWILVPKIKQKEQQP